MKAKNNVAVYRPGSKVNKSVRDHAAGKQPGRDSIMSTDDYQDNLLFKNVKKPSPKTR